jgi:hypothetical protein
MAEVPDPGTPDGSENLFEKVTLTVEDFIPLVNIARNSFLAALQVGMPPFEAMAIQMETYKMVLAHAMGVSS